MVKRPPFTMPGNMYIPCEYCYGFYSQHTVQAHMSAWREPGNKKKSTLTQCRTLLSKYIMPKQDEFERDLDSLLSGLSETSKYPGKKASHNCVRTCTNIICARNFSQINLMHHILTYDMV